LSNLEIVRFIKKQSESLGGVISNQAAQLLISLIGNNLWQIENELTKLVNYKFLKTPKLFKTKSYVKPPVIEIEDVKQLVRGNLDENIFALTDAISNKNRKLAAELIEDQNKAGLSDGHILTMVIRQFRILMQVRQALDSGFTSKKIISSLKLHPFVAQKGINQVRNFNLIYLKKTFDDLINIEYKTKLGQTSAKLMLNLLISKI